MEPNRKKEFAEEAEDLIRNREKEFTEEAEDLIRNHGEGPPELDVLERIFQLGVWSRGSTLPRGTLFMSAAARLGEDSIAILLKWLNQNPANAEQRKVLLAIGQWAGASCFDALKIAIRNAGRDTETLQYCISALRLIGGPKAGNLLVDLMKMPNEPIQKEAISAVMDLATGGSASDIDSATNAPIFPQGRLEDLLHLRLGQTLDTLRHSTRLPLALRLQAEEARAWLVRNELLNPALPPDGKVAHARSWLDALIRGWAWRPALNPADELSGGPREEQPVYYVPVNLTGTEFRAILALHPLPAPERADVLVPGIFFLSVNKRVVANIGLREDPLPEKISAVRVSVAVGEVELDAYGGPLVLKPGEQRVAEFPIPEDSLREWCEHPKFVLKPVPAKSVKGGAFRKADMPVVVYRERVMEIDS